jgi:hypothetical protein
MLVDVLKGKEYAQELVDHLVANNSKRPQLLEAQRFLILHVKVIHALCRHYVESSAIQRS